MDTGISISAVQAFSGFGWCGMVQGFSNGFIFEHIVPATSLLDYQTIQKVAARSGERNENEFFFINTARLFETVNETDIQVTLSKRRRLFYSL